MANISQLVRRQSSQSLDVNQLTVRSLNQLEMLEFRQRLVTQDSVQSHYGSTNVAMADGAALKEEEGEDSALEGEQEGDTRQNWDNKLQFLLATIGYAVGLGNVWRFPYLAQKNGGGAFLIPYFVMLAIEGIPIFYLELAIGQRLRKGAIGVWNQVSPFMAGIGIASAIVSFNVALYYNTIIAWCLYYLFHSFQMPLPWTSCPNVYYPNGSYTVNAECQVSSPTQYFWYRDTLDISSDINELGNYNWRITLCLFVAWLLVYACMVKGIVSSPKVVYITALFPYVVLIIFFFRGITLPGMKDGIFHLFEPDWSKLKDPVVWLEAGTQIFFSLGLAFGGLIAFASYNPVSSNCYRDAVFVAITNCLTSMFAGLVVFSVIGFKAHTVHEACLLLREEILNGTHVNQTLPECNLKQELSNSASGTGLAFIVFTEAINQFPWAPFWSVLFFSMLFTLGLDSQFGTLEGVMTSIVDLKLFPNVRKEILTGCLCLVCFILSCIFTFGNGNYIFTLFDNFAGNVPLLMVALFECIAVSYVYGLDKFSDDISLMVGQRPSWYWLLCWRYISPVAMIIILVASFMKMMLEGSGYEVWIAETGTKDTHVWPTWGLILIGFLILVSFLWIPGVALGRCLGYTIFVDDDVAWFPTDELRAFRASGQYFPTDAEKLLFNMKDPEPIYTKPPPKKDGEQTENG